MQVWIKCGNGFEKQSCFSRNGNSLISTFVRVLTLWLSKNGSSVNYYGLGFEIISEPVPERTDRRSLAKTEFWKSRTGNSYEMKEEGFCGPRISYLLSKFHVTGNATLWRGAIFQMQKSLRGTTLRASWKILPRTSTSPILSKRSRQPVNRSGTLLLARSPASPN